MPCLPTRFLLSSSVTSLFATLVLQGPGTAQQITVADGNDFNDVRVRIVQAGSGPVIAQTLLASIKLLPLESTNRTQNEFAETRRARLLRLDGADQFVWPNGDRLFHFENNLQQQVGLLFVPADGAARVVYSTGGSAVGPVSVGRRHAAFTEGGSLTIVRLDGTVHASSGLGWRTVTFPDNVRQESVTVGSDCSFCVLDDGRVFRVPHADAAPAAELTPPGTAAHVQIAQLTISDDGSTVAFLRGPDVQQLRIWIANATGPARAVGGPLRAWRAPEPLPGGLGRTWMTFAADGSSLVATEAAIEDELHLFDTAPLTILPPSMHLTANEQFAEYIGAHVLPWFAADGLMFASGHAQQMDWYLVDPSNGQAQNLTQTGAPEPPYLVGSLDVESRFELGDGTAIVTDRVADRSTARRLAIGTGSPAMFSDLLEQPAIGGSLDGWPDLRLRGDGGDRLLSGLDGSVLLSLPAGLELGTPVRSTEGWIAFTVALQGGPAVLALRLADGSLVVGPVYAAAPELRIDAADRLLVRDATTLQVFAPAVSASFTASAMPFVRLLSGAGNQS